MWHAAVLATEYRSLFWKLLMALFTHLFPLLREAANCYRDLLCYYDKKLFWRKVGLVLWTPRSLCKGFQPVYAEGGTMLFAAGIHRLDNIC